MKYLRVFESIDLDPGVFHCDAGQCVSRCTQLPGRVTRQSILNGLRSLSALYSWHTLRPHQSTCSEMNGTRSLEINIRTWKADQKRFNKYLQLYHQLKLKPHVSLSLPTAENFIEDWHYWIFPLSLLLQLRLLLLIFQMSNRDMESSLATADKTYKTIRKYDTLKLYQSKASSWELRRLLLCEASNKFHNQRFRKKTLRVVNKIQFPKICSHLCKDCQKL